MTRISTFALGIALLLVGALRADVPLPPDIKYVDPRVRFENIDKFADQVFCLRFQTFNGGPGGTPYTVIEVKDTNAFNLKAQRRIINMQLLTMNRDDFTKRAKDDPSLKWLNDKVDGVSAANMTAPSTTAPSSVKEAPVTTYRVQLKEGKLKVETVEEKKGSLLTPGRPRVWVIGLAGSLLLTSLGLWFVRRRPQARGIH